MSGNRPKKQASPSDLILEYTKAIESNPKNAAAFFNRGKIYQEQGKHDQAMDDYKQAVQIDPELEAQIEFPVASPQKRGDDLKKIPDPVLVDKQSSLLDLADLARLSRTDQHHHKLFKPKIALKQLLSLVVNYEMKDEEKIQSAIARGINPILEEVDALLQQDSSLALKRGDTSDHFGRKKLWSPLEAAYWSGNWELLNIMIKHTQLAGTSEAAAKQLDEWDKQASNYDLMLMRTEGDTLEKLVELVKKNNKSVLIKDSMDKIFQWGDVNGEWQLTELDDDTKKLFAHLHFPDTASEQPIRMPSKQITSGMYEALKKGHTPAHFDLGEYLRVIAAYSTKYPDNVLIPRPRWNEFDTDSLKIGRAQIKFPAWLAAIWCAKISFFPLPDFKSLIASPDACRLKLHAGNDFFDGRLGKDASIYLFMSGKAQYAGYGKPPQQFRIRQATASVAPMDALCKMITAELLKAKQLLLKESKATPRISK